MVDIKTILSDVQMDLGDNAHTAIQRAEYVDNVNNILRMVARETRIWINRKVYTPNDGTGTDPVYQVHILAEDSPVKLLAVYRKALSESKYVECREYGRQSNLATMRNNPSFQKNDLQLGRIHFHTQYLDEDTNTVDDGRYLIFNTAFETGEQVAVDFVSGSPISIALWSENMTLQVPDFLEDTIRYGLQYRLMERIFNRGRDEYLSRVQIAKENYTTALNKARAIARNYLDENSQMVITPWNYLPETPNRSNV